MPSLFKKNTSSSDDSIDKTDKKPSLYQRFQDKKRGPGPSDEDILKYTGKTREELRTWADDQPGVGKNQLAGKLAVGATSGLGGAGAAGGLGGWGMGAEPGNAKDRGMKYPPEQKETKEI